MLYPHFLDYFSKVRVETTYAVEKTWRRGQLVIVRRRQEREESENAISDACLKAPTL